MAKAVIRKPKKESAQQDPEKWVSHNFEFKHDFIVSIKMMEGGELIEGVPTWEEVQEEIRDLLRERFPQGNFTPSGGYIIIREDDGRVRACYPGDFDYETMDRRPGTHPPLYTLSHEEQKEVRALQLEVEKRVQREKAREEATGNSLARNPTNLLTLRETTKVQKIRNKAHSKPPQNVEWTEEDVADESLAEKETEKLLSTSPTVRKRRLKRVQ